MTSEIEEMEMFETALLEELNDRRRPIEKRAKIIKDLARVREDLVRMSNEMMDVQILLDSRRAIDVMVRTPDNKSFNLSIAQPNGNALYEALDRKIGEEKAWGMAFVLAGKVLADNFDPIPLDVIEGGVRLVSRPRPTSREDYERKRDLLSKSRDKLTALREEQSTLGLLAQEALERKDYPEYMLIMEKEMTATRELLREQYYERRLRKILKRIG